MSVKAHIGQFKESEAADSLLQAEGAVRSLSSKIRAQSLPVHCPVHPHPGVALRPTIQ